MPSLAGEPVTNFDSPEGISFIPRYARPSVFPFDVRRVRRADLSVFAILISVIIYGYIDR